MRELYFYIATPPESYDLMAVWLQVAPSPFQYSPPTIKFLYYCPQTLRETNCNQMPISTKFCTMEKYYYGFDPFWPSASVAYNALPGSTHVGSRTPTPSPHPVPFSPHSSTANKPVPRSFCACISCPMCYRKSRILWGFDPPGHIQTQSAGRGDR